MHGLIARTFPARASNPRARIALAALPLLLALAPAAAADSSLIQRIQSGLDGVARGINYLGQKAEGFIGPGIGIGGPRTAAYTERRQFVNRYPAGPAPVISVASEFGRIQVEAWDERVVQVSAEIIVGAESAGIAAEVARAIDINVAQADNAFEIRTHFPDTRRDMGHVAMEVHYTVNAPAGASINASNFMGDTVIRGIAGPVAVDAQYGMVDLQQLTGPVKVRAHGEFPLIAQGLPGGGAFQLNGAAAEFANVGGLLQVSNFRGAVTLRELAPEIQANIVSDSGPIHLVLPSGAQPDLSATALYGKIESDVRLDRTVRANLAVGRGPNVESAQQIDLHASFADIRIERPGGEGEAPPAAIDDAKPFNDVLAYTETAGPGMTLHVDAMVGDVRIEPGREDRVDVAATRIVWVRAAAQAPPALDALQVSVRTDRGRVNVSTLSGVDPVLLGAASYRVDLRIQAPPRMPIEVHGQDGLTAITDMRGPVTVNQSTGAILVERSQGDLELRNYRGDIRVFRATGAVDASSRYGTLTLGNILGPIVAHNVQGRTVVEGPLGPLTVRAASGDVRVLALDGIGGDYDLQVEKGALSILLPSFADAAITAVAEEGSVKSSIPLEGSISSGRQEFRGRLSDGRRQVRLHARAGDILID